MSTLNDPAWKKNEELVARIYELTGPPPDWSELEGEPASGSEFLKDADAIVSHIEVNDKHGVGVLLRRLFRKRKNVLTVRSQDHHGGEQDFGDLALRLAHGESTRDAVFKGVLDAMEGNTVARVLAVPYYPDDVRNALALAEIYGAPLCTYLMDDQNICAAGIPDELMSELLERSRLRLAISPELAVTYELKYGQTMWFMPPVATAEHILGELSPPAALNAGNPVGAMVGNIWGQRWLDLLRETVRDSGVTLHWYSNSHFRFLEGDSASLAQDAIIVPDGPPLADGDLIEVLRQTPFVVIPTGTLDDDDDRSFIAQLSLPSRIPFILATAHTPVIVLGNERTGAARFVQDLGIGLVCPYERVAFGNAVARIMQPETNLAMRRKALSVANSFSDRNALDWIWQSLERGAPIDNRYQKMMPEPKPDLSHLVRKP